MSPDTATMLDDIAACGLPVIAVDLTFPTIDPAAPTSARELVLTRSELQLWPVQDADVWRIEQAWLAVKANSDAAMTYRGHPFDLGKVFGWL